MENVSIIRKDSTAIDADIKAMHNVETIASLFSEEEVSAIREAYIKKFDEAINGEVNCANIATIRNVTTTSVVTFFNNNYDERVVNIKETIKAIGAGKPKKSQSEKIKELLDAGKISVEELKALIGG